MLDPSSRSRCTTNKLKKIEEGIDEFLNRTFQLRPYFASVVQSASMTADGWRARHMIEEEKEKIEEKRVTGRKLRKRKRNGERRQY